MGLNLEGSVCHVRERPNSPGDRVGELLAGRYRVLRRLGTGGMGTVYLAEHLHLGRLTAVKVLCPPLLSPGCATRASLRCTTSTAGPTASSSSRWST